MSLPAEAHAAQTRRFPRVSGDEPFGHALIMLTLWFSPRERG